MSIETISDRQLTVGTRASPLAFAQTRHVVAAFAQAHNLPQRQLNIVEIITEGDRRLDTKLAEIGGKGLFTEELEAGLLEHRFDLAVHSLKDLPTDQPDGLVLAAILPRAKAHDVLVPRAGLNVNSLADLPRRAKIGTSALRRQAQILNLRPDMEIVPLRGNVGTRLQKLESENLEAIILAAAGLERLALSPQGAVSLADDVVSAAGQGALAVQCRAADSGLIAALAALHCRDTYDCIMAERHFLAALDGSCRTPIAAHARLDGDMLRLTGRLLDDDGVWLAAAQGEAPRGAADILGRSLAAKVADQAAKWRAKSQN